MKNIKNLAAVILLSFFVFTACNKTKDVKPSEDAESQAENVKTSKEDSLKKARKKQWEEAMAKYPKIKISAQPLPFQDVKEHDMAVINQPDDLAIVSAKEAALADDDLVLGIVLNGKAIAYPIAYLAGREVVNDLVNGAKNLVATWCPISGTARMLLGDDEAQSFDFGSALHNNNLLIVDRQTSSTWSQIAAESILGPLKGKKIGIYPSQQSTWKYWLAKHPETLIMGVPKKSPRKYVYRTYGPGQERPKVRPTQHNTSLLGIGFTDGEDQLFLPFSSLGQDPVSVKLNGKSIRVFYDNEGMTAWAEDAQGNPIDGLLAYNWAWKGFYANSRVYDGK